MTGTGAADLAEVARAPIVGAQRPAGLKRLRHHLLDPLAADRISEVRDAEQAVGQAGDEGDGRKRIAAGRRRGFKRASLVHSASCHRNRSEAEGWPGCDAAAGSTAQISEPRLF